MEAALPGLGNIQPSPSHTQTHKHRCKQAGSSLRQRMYLFHRPQILKGGALLLPVFCSLLDSLSMAVAQDSQALRNTRPKEDKSQWRWKGIKALSCQLWHFCFGESSLTSGHFVRLFSLLYSVEGLDHATSRRCKVHGSQRGCRRV